MNTEYYTIRLTRKQCYVIANAMRFTNKARGTQRDAVVLVTALDEMVHLPATGEVNDMSVLSYEDTGVSPNTGQ